MESPAKRLLRDGVSRGSRTSDPSAASSSGGGSGTARGTGAITRKSRVSGTAPGTVTKHLGILHGIRTLLPPLWGLQRVRTCRIDPLWTFRWPGLPSGTRRSPRHVHMVRSRVSTKARRHVTRPSTRATGLPVKGPSGKDPRGSMECLPQSSDRSHRSSIVSPSRW